MSAHLIINYRQRDDVSRVYVDRYVYANAANMLDMNRDRVETWSTAVVDEHRLMSLRRRRRLLQLKNNK